VVKNHPQILDSLPAFKAGVFMSGPVTQEGQARRSVSGAIARGSDADNATDEGALSSFCPEFESRRPRWTHFFYFQVAKNCAASGQENKKGLTER